MTMYPDDHAPWGRNRKHPPLVQGGQGRDSANVTSSATTIAFLLIMTAFVASVAYLAGGNS